VVVFGEAILNTIGGSVVEAGNVIAGNAGSGVSILGNQASDTWLLSNWLGTNSALAAGLGNFDHKVFVRDLVELKLRPDALNAALAKRFGDEEAKKLVAELQSVAAELRKQPDRPIETMRKYPRLVEHYSTCTADIENDGHRFGEGLPEVDKKALIAFLATL
jgi:hypothetical protein